MAPRVPPSSAHSASTAMLRALNAQFDQTAHELGVRPEIAARIRPTEADLQVPAKTRIARTRRMMEGEGYSAMERRAIELLAAQSHQSMVVDGLEKALRAARDELGKVNTEVQVLKTKLRNRP